MLHGTAVITTATDSNDLPALDMLAREHGCVIIDWDKVKVVNSALLRGQKVQVSDPMQTLGALPTEYFTMVRLPGDEGTAPFLDTSQPAVSVDWRAVPAHDNLLRLAVPALHVGIGCKKEVSQEEILQAIASTLATANMAHEALASLASAVICSACRLKNGDSGQPCQHGTNLFVHDSISIYTVLFVYY